MEALSDLPAQWAGFFMRRAKSAGGRTGRLRHSLIAASTASRTSWTGGAALTRRKTPFHR